MEVGRILSSYQLTNKLVGPKGTTLWGHNKWYMKKKSSQTYIHDRSGPNGSTLKARTY